jgi:hypothetical protein
LVDVDERPPMILFFSRSAIPESIVDITLLQPGGPSQCVLQDEPTSPKRQRSRRHDLEE